MQSDSRPPLLQRCAIACRGTIADSKYTDRVRYSESRNNKCLVINIIIIVALIIYCRTKLFDFIYIAFLFILL